MLGEEDNRNSNREERKKVSSNPSPPWHVSNRYSAHIELPDTLVVLQLIPELFIN